MKDFKQLASNVIKEIGGKENITESWHCVTRLRFNLKDKNIVKIESIKKISGVIGAQFSGNQFQVIIGNDVAKVYEEVSAQIGNLPQNSENNNQKEGLISKLMDTISGIFTPALPALVGTGLLKGFLALFIALGWMTDSSTLYSVLNMVSDCAFYFLPFLLAVSSARKFKTNEYLALCIAGGMLYPTMTEGYNALLNGGEVASMQLFGILPIPFLAYSSSVIPIILAVWCLKYVYNFVKKIMPAVLTTMFTPMLTLLIVIPLTLVIFGPIGTYAGALLSGVLLWLFENVGILAGALVGACYPLLVMTGMHWALMPIMLTSFTDLGYDASMAPAMLAATFAMAGATFGVFFKTKNTEMKQLSLSSGISALLGITEPAMYGVTLKLRKPFYGAMVGGAISGLIMNVFQIKNYGMSMPGLIALAGYVDKNNEMNIIVAIIGSAIAFLVAAVCTYLIGFTEEESINTLVVPNKTDKNETLVAPATGTIIPVDTLSDNTFAEEIMGKTFAIQPTEGQVNSPVKGKVVMIAETNHAIGIRSESGIEILIHIGIDTVELKGSGFIVQVSVEDDIKVGTPLIKEDLELMKDSGYDPVVMMIVTNSQDYLNVLPVNQEDQVKSGEEVAVVVK